MNIVNLAQLAAVSRRSPRGRFLASRQNLTAALGASQDRGPASGGHPFDVERATIPPGAQNFPVHAHAAQWEFYFIEAGNGTLLTADAERPLSAGDFFMCAPGQAHALRNDGTTDLRYWVVADNPPADVIHYPRSNKWLAKPGRLTFRDTIDYYDGEE